MRVAIMQPYFFPYIGYWQLMAMCDQWVFFDYAQFNKRSWMTRNRILHSDPAKEFQYINLATDKNIFGQKILDVRIKSSENAWKEKILSQLELYQNLDAPYFIAVKELVENILSSGCELVSSQAEAMAVGIMEYLDLDIKVAHSSKIDFNKNEIRSAGDWALEISKAMGASSYVNPVNGAGLFDEKKYLASGIKLAFLQSKLPEYDQAGRRFTPGLSILDVLMFNSKTDVVEMLKDEYMLLSKNDVN